jgi:HSP20 family molecular chaperone IbpA
LSTSSKISPILDSVDEKSRRIITYILRERHAGIRELSNLINASSDMEVLMRIRDAINPKAQKLMGKPLITFEQSKTDFLTGERILFSWWTNEEADSVDDEYSVEVMEEEKLLRIIAALPPQEENVDITVADYILIISGEKYYREVPLFCPVENAAEKILHNGVLEVKLNKLCDEKCQ